MVKRALPELSKPELEVMKSLWRHGRSSAREIHGHAGERCGWAYSTTRTMLERMVKKGLLAKRDFHGIYLYTTKISKAQGLAGLVKDFAERILEMDHAPVVSLFAEGKTLTAAEIAELEELLETGKEDD